MRQWWLWLPLVSLCAVSAENGQEAWWWSLAQCIREDETTKCVVDRAVDILQKNQSTGRKADSTTENTGEELSSAIGDAFFKELGEMITVGVSRLLPFFGGDDGEDNGFSETEGDDEDDDNDGEADEQEKDVEEGDDATDGETALEGGKTGNNNRNGIEGRGKKLKQKIHNLIVKILMLKMLMKQKVNNLLSGASVLLQLSFLGFLVINLLINKVRLYLEFAKHKEPQKVVYYEHAQHQHHYDDDEHKPWSLFGSSRNDVEDPHNIAYSSHVPPKPYIRYHPPPSSVI